MRVRGPRAKNVFGICYRSAASPFWTHDEDNDGASTTIMSHSHGSSASSSSLTTLVALAFGAGCMAGICATALVVLQQSSTKSIDRDNAGAVIEDNDLSLFYGDVKQLTEITQARKFLPDELYGPMVRNAVVCCVDILLVRQQQQTLEGKQKQIKQALLVERSSEPAKGLWWLPGGRLLKGETFFAAAIRKAQQETGLTNVRPIQVLGVWNTFFPTSHWDTDDSPPEGTQTVNPIVLVEVMTTDPTTTTTSNNDVKLDATSENYRWIDLDPKNNASEDKYVLQALLRLRAWNPKYIDYS
ncbi:hypothetical protein ACA910_017028 [Epithemia clementina (nom. ined.)]